MEPIVMRSSKSHIKDTLDVVKRAKWSNDSLPPLPQLILTSHNWGANYGLIYANFEIFSVFSLFFLEASTLYKISSTWNNK